MKKIICIVLSAFLAISMAACSSSNDAKGKTSSQETGSSVVEESSDSEETPAALTELPEWVEKDSGADVVVTFGAGNIDRLVEPIAQIYNNRK